MEDSASEESATEEELLCGVEDRLHNCGNSLQKGRTATGGREVLATDVVCAEELGTAVGTHLQHWPEHVPPPHDPEHTRTALTGQVIGTCVQRLIAGS